MFLNQCCITGILRDKNPNKSRFETAKEEADCLHKILIHYKKATWVWVLKEWLFITRRGIVAVTLWLKRCFAYFWLQENTRLKNRKEEKELRRTNRNIIVKKLGKDKNLQIFNIVVMIFKWYQYCRVTERSSLGWSFDSKDLATEYFGIVLVIPYRAQCLVEKTRPTLAFNQIQI